MYILETTVPGIHKIVVHSLTRYRDMESRTDDIKYVRRNSRDYNKGFFERGQWVNSVKTNHLGVSDDFDDGRRRRDHPHCPVFYMHGVRGEEQFFVENL